MKRNPSLLAIIAIALCAFTAAIIIQPQVHAQDDQPILRRAPHCSNGTASGTYGYRMSGQLVGVGPFLVNGIFTHYPDGAMDGDVHLTLGDQQIPTKWSGGTFKTNDDCTGSGKFFVQALNLEITYNFIATDGGEQIELLNTNSGVVLHGVCRRISQAGFAPRCNNGTVLGAYGYRLDGSNPGAQHMAVSGVLTHRIDGGYNGLWTGSDTLNLMGQYFPRANQGTYKMESNCRGAGSYTDNLGNSVNYVFVAVDGGDTIYFQGTDPGVAVSGVGRRIR